MAQLQLPWPVTKENEFITARRERDLTDSWPSKHSIIKACVQQDALFESRVCKSSLLLPASALTISFMKYKLLCNVIDTKQA